MWQQGLQYGVGYHEGRVTSLFQNCRGFTARMKDSDIRARTVLLAIGISNRRPRTGISMTKL
jgi:hypothetical protein